MKQKLITTILIIIAIFAPLLITPIILYKFPTSYLIKDYVLLIGGGSLVVLLLSCYKSLKIDKKDILIISFLGLVLLSTWYSPNVKTSIFGQDRRYEGLLAFISYTAIYLSAKKYFIVKDSKEAKAILYVLFVFSLIIGIIGILQRHINCGKLFPIFNRGICATFGNSNFFGSYISVVLPISCLLFIFKRSKCAFILSLVYFFNLISCLTRSAWVAFAIVSIFILIYLIKEKNKKYFLRAGILLFLFILIFFYVIYGFSYISSKMNYQSKVTIKTIKQTEQKYSKIGKEVKIIKEKGNINKLGSSRVEIWKMGFKLMIRRPLLGSGPDNFFDGLSRYCKEENDAYIARTNSHADKAHNEYLHIGATIGIPALVIYLIFICSIMFPKLKVVFENKVILILFLTISSYLIQAFFNISTIGIAPLFYMLLGLIDNKEFIDNVDRGEIIEQKEN